MSESRGLGARLFWPLFAAFYDLRLPVAVSCILPAVAMAGITVSPAGGKDYYASGSAEVTALTQNVTQSSARIAVRDSSSFLPHQGIRVLGGGASRTSYIGIVTASKGNSIDVDPPLSSPLPAGTRVEHDDSAAFLSALADLKLSGAGGKLYLSRGVYNLGSRQIAIDFNNVVIEGEGRGNTIVTYSGGDCAFQASAGPTALQYHLAFRSFSLLVTAAGGSGICLSRPAYAAVSDMYIENGSGPGQTGRALVLDGSSNFGTGVLIQNNRFNQWRRAILLTGNPAAGYMTRSRIVDNEIDGKSTIESGSVAVEMYLAQNCTVDGGNIEHWETGLRLNGAQQNTIRSVRFENLSSLWNIASNARGNLVVGNMLLPGMKFTDASGTTTMFANRNLPDQQLSPLGIGGPAAAGASVNVTSSPGTHQLRLSGDNGLPVDLSGNGSDFVISSALRSDLLRIRLNTGDVAVQGQLSGRGLREMSSGPRPVCNSANRGDFFIAKGDAGVADLPEVCVKRSDDSYSWIPLAIVP